MIATRSIKKHDGTVQVMFAEKCCETPLTIDKDDSRYATCTQCLRVRRVMQMNIAGKGEMTIWGLYYDPNLAKTKAGQFMAMLGCDMEVAIHPDDWCQADAEGPVCDT